MPELFPILVLSAGRRVELCRLLRDDAAAVGMEAVLVAADANPHQSAACLAADESHQLPPAQHNEYGDAVVELVHRCGARLVIPTIDPELRTLALLREQLARHGVLTNVSTLSVVDTARDKLRTASALRDAGLATPRTAHPQDVLTNASSWDWPLIVKPIDGSASLGVAVVSTPQMLADLSRSDSVVQERLTGHEVTVNVFIDDTGMCQAAVPHLRREVRAGEVSKGITFRDPILSDLARAVAAALPGAFGVLCFQVFLTSGGPVVFEINARFGGGFPLAHRAGAPFTRWLIELAAGRSPAYHDRWIEGTCMLRHDSAEYVVMPAGQLRQAWFV